MAPPPVSLKFFEREGEVHPDVVPNIITVFGSGLVDVLKLRDPDLVLETDSIPTERIAVDEDQKLPGADPHASLILMVSAPGNTKLVPDGHVTGFDAEITHMLWGCIPINGVYAYVTIQS